MPPPKNLAGMTFGKLHVIRQTGFANDSRKSAIWLCQCECGRQEEISQAKLPHSASSANKRGARYECTVCMRGPCVICGGAIERETKSNTCSNECNSQKIKTHSLNAYYKNVSLDPDYNKKYWKKIVDKMQSDYEYAEKFRSQRNIISKRWLKTKKGTDWRKEYHRIWYQNNRERKLESNKMVLDSIPIEERRRYWREYRKKFYDHLKENPEEYKKFRDNANQYSREYYNKSKQEKLLQEMQELAKKLQDKLDDE